MNANHTMIRNIAAFTEALGVENAALIFYLSTRVPWADDDDRDDFIRDLTMKDPRRTAQEQRV